MLNSYVKITNNVDLCVLQGMTFGFIHPTWPRCWAPGNNIFTSHSIRQSYKAVKFGMVTNSRRFYGDWLSRPPTGLCWEHLAVVERMHSPECSSSYYLFMNSDTLILLPVAEVYEVIVFMLIISEKLCYCWFYFCHALVLTYLYGKLNFRLIGWSLLLI